MTEGMVASEVAELLGKSVGLLTREDFAKAEGPDVLYSPHPRLASAIEALLARIPEAPADDKREARDRQRDGAAMEQVATLAFRGLKGAFRPDSYTSPMMQIDLLFMPSDDKARLLASYLQLPARASGYLVECKATEDQVDDRTFDRLCSLLQFNFKDSVHLGIFVTLNGASGFPGQKKPGTKKGTKAAKARAGVRQTKLGQCRLRQVLFYYATRKPVVVLRRRDLDRLANGENLVKILHQKVMDIELLNGLSEVDEKLASGEMPEHIREAMAL